MNRYFLSGIFLAWCVSLAGVGVWQRGAGAGAERARWQGRALAEAQEAARAVQRQEDAARTKEQQQAREINRIAQDLQKDSQNEISKRNAIIARYRNADFGLRQPAAAAVPPGFRSASGVAADPAAGHGDERRALLSGQLEWLAGEAVRADRCLARLAACRKVALEDRQ